MKKTILFIFPVIAFAAVSLYSCSQTESAEQNQSSTQVQNISNEPLSKDSLERLGGYLVTITGCNDCHTPKIFGPKGPELDQKRLLSGYPSDRPIPKFPAAEVAQGKIVVNSDLTCAMGPWGTSFAGNISSDATGIGNWTFLQFETALRHGKYKGLENSRPLMPPMPWQNLANLKNDDIKAIFYYLKSTTPVANIVPGFIPLRH